MISSGLPALHDRLEHGQQRLQARQLLLVDEDVRLLQLHRHLVGIGDEVGRQVAAVELHALDDLELAVEALGLLDRDHALVADLLHGLGDHVADGLLAVGSHGADLGDLGRVLDLLGPLLDLLDHLGHGLLDAALEVHGVHAGRDRLHAFAQDRVRQNRGRGGAVTGHVVGLLGDLAHHLRAHVLELVLELDLLGDGHAVLGRARRAVRFFDDDVAALGPERDPHRVGEDIDAAQHAVACVGGKANFLGSHLSLQSRRSKRSRF